MATYKRFEELPIWKNAKDLAVEVYRIVSIEKFNKDFNLIDQICRCAVSVSSNISEGFERCSRKEFIRFLYIAKGSLGELRSRLAIAYELKYISKDVFEKLNSKCLELSRQIAGFVKYLRNEK